MTTETEMVETTETLVGYIPVDMAAFIIGDPLYMGEVDAFGGDPARVRTSFGVMSPWISVRTGSDGLYPVYEERTRDGDFVSVRVMSPWFAD